jgi:hypothetical protein
MSNPQNPLNFYRTYAYHHVLIAANSTAVLDEMSKPDFETTNLTREVSRNRIDVHTIDGAGQYVVVTNGMQNADFFIEEMTWEMVMVPQMGKGMQTYTTMGLEGTMKVVEPQGVRFLQHLNNIFDRLGCDPVGITFIVKTIFMGYPDGTNNEGLGAQSVANVRPLGFTLFDIMSNFDAAGSEYEMSFLGSVNGTAKLPQVQNGLAQGVSSVKAFTEGEEPAPDTLSNVVDRFKKLMNDKYNEWFDQMDDSDNVGDRYRRVEYDIKLDPEYANSEYLVDDFQQRVGEDINEGVVAFLKDSTIEQAIDRIMQSCSRVLTDSKPESEGGTSGDTQYVYKTHSAVNSTVNSDNSGTYKLTYVISKYEVPLAAPGKGLQPDNIDPKSSIEFDYLFTGNNTDVIDFDIKMDTGLLFLMTISPNRNMTDGAESLNNKLQDTDKNVTGSNQNAHYVTRVNTPLFPKQNNTLGEVQHSKSSLDKLSFRALLNRHALLSSMDAKLVIKGNPILLNDLIISPDDLANNRFAATAGTIMRDWAKSPGLVKLNIRMPSDDPSLTNTLTEPFWYQGFYQIISVSNKFNKGEFTQELDMIALPQTNDVLASTTNQQPLDPIEVNQNEIEAPTKDKIDSQRGNQ